MNKLGFLIISDSTIAIQIMTALFYFGTVIGHYFGNTSEDLLVKH